MPELAEVEYFRKQWDPGLNQVVHAVQLHREARVFRDCDTRALERGLTRVTLAGSMAAGKQMAFRSSTGGWLGIHLGMTGSLAHYPPGYRPLKADHLVLSTPAGALVFSDPRMFGRVDFSEANQTPAWWARIPAPVASESFTSKDLVHFLNRRRKSPLKAVLLMQERFPGIGNWMADEILWRAELHPRLPAGALTATQTLRLHRECQWVCRRALETIGKTFRDPPKSWLFPHRWQEGGRCPRTGEVLVRETVGGRTTCWSPGRQQRLTSAA
jgi:formamidopyrimidine-DNA glycosylase